MIWLLLSAGCTFMANTQFPSDQWFDNPFLFALAVIFFGAYVRELRS